MEEQIISLYSKLKSNIYKPITVTYYSHKGEYKTEKCKLIDVSGFSYITVSDNKICKELCFFDISSLIESITIEGDDKPIYFNPYAKEFKDTEDFEKTEVAKKIKNAFLSSTSINQMITPRESFLINYYEEKDFSFDDLFFSDKQKKEFKNFFTLIANELISYAKNNGFDPSIKLIGSGSTSFVYNIGDKILKFGKPRKKVIIPYCEYLLQPIMNRDVVFDGIPMHIEVTQKVITYRDLGKNSYQQFKKALTKLKHQMSAIGLKWSDLHIGNIGILTQDNIVNFDEIPFELGNHEKTFAHTNNNLAVRKKGEFVIIDLDYIEIVNMRKYCRYLARIGYNNEEIAEIKDEHSGKVK